ncbi:hypothetical protein Mgra_00007856, partial [Meloidogyne graminicola]
MNSIFKYYLIVFIIYCIIFNVFTTRRGESNQGERQNRIQIRGITRNIRRNNPSTTLNSAINCIRNLHKQIDTLSEIIAKMLQ